MPRKCYPSLDDGFFLNLSEISKRFCEEIVAVWIFKAISAINLEGQTSATGDHLAAWCVSSFGPNAKDRESYHPKYLKDSRLTIPANTCITVPQ